MREFTAAPNPAVTLERVQAFNLAIEVEAPYVSASIVNIFGESSPEDFAFDENGFHPTKSGHRRIAAAFRKVILERLKSWHSLFPIPLRLDASPAVLTPQRRYL